MAKSEHDRAVNRLAKRYGGKHRKVGTDLLSRGRTIEVATNIGDLYQSLGQLANSRANIKYMAVPSRLIEKAIQQTKGTGIGVMNTQGIIKKKPRRRR